MKTTNLFTKSLVLSFILAIFFAADTVAQPVAPSTPDTPAKSIAPDTAAQPVAPLTPNTPAQSVTPDPALKGQFTRCSYKPPLDKAYVSAEIWYPCETAKGPFAATTLTGGYFNSHDDMRWIAYHLVTHGYIVIAVTPGDVMGKNPVWTEAHKSAISMLKSENTSEASKIKGIVDTTKLQIMGFGKGGGGVLLASAILGKEIKSTQALSPLMDDGYDLEDIKSATICYAGRDDDKSPAGKVVSMYKDVAFVKVLAYFNNFPNRDWLNTGEVTNQTRAKIYITSWMKYYLDNNKDYQTYLFGEQHENHVKDGWFYDYRTGDKKDGWTPW